MVSRTIGVLGSFETMVPWNQGTGSSAATGFSCYLDANTT